MIRKECATPQYCTSIDDFETYKNKSSVSTPAQIFGPNDFLSFNWVFELWLVAEQDRQFATVRKSR